MADPDPFEALKHPGDAGTPLPAAEVRARGDRLRRRRTTFRAVAAAAAVAVVTTGGVVIGERVTGSTGPLPPASQAPSPRPSESDPPERVEPVAWVTRIPEGFPLALGYPEVRFDEQVLEGPGADVPVLERLRACDVTARPRAGGEDRLGVRFAQPEDTRARLLTTFDTGESAASVLDRHRAMYRDCPREEQGYGGVTLTEVRGVAPGDEGFVAIRTYEQDGIPALGLELVYVVRVGNALLLQSTSTEGGGNEQEILTEVREQTEVVTELAVHMCVFAQDRCSTPTDADASEAAEEPGGDQDPATLGPDGFAGVELGMTGAEIEATGRVTLEPGSEPGCSRFSVLSPEGSEQIVGGYLSEAHGVELITLDVNGAATSARTPEDITPESTLAEVRSTYPQGRWFDPTYVAAVPGQQDRQYSFVFAGGEATGLLSMGLHLRDSSCSPNVTGR